MVARPQCKLSLQPRAGSGNPQATTQVTLAHEFSFHKFSVFSAAHVQVTGVFCQSAIESSQNDHLTVAQSLNDNNEAHVTRLRTIFAELGACNSDGITFHAFEEKMHDPAVKEHLGQRAGVVLQYG